MNGNQVVSARDLYEYLEVSERFSRWFERMCSYGLIINIDYTPYQNVHPSNNQNLDDYALTLDCAKEMSMLQRNDKGKQARKYFIEVEKQAKKPMTQAEQLLHSAQMLVEQERKLSEHDSRILQLEAKTTTRPEYFTVAGYGTLIGVPVNFKMASSLGRKASDICKHRELPIDKIPDPRFGKVNSYPKQVLEEVFSKQVN